MTSITSCAAPKNFSLCAVVGLVSYEGGTHVSVRKNVCVRVRVHVRVRVRSCLCVCVGVKYVL